VENQILNNEIVCFINVILMFFFLFLICMMF